MLVNKGHFVNFVSDNGNDDGYDGNLLLLEDDDTKLQYFAVINEDSSHAKDKKIKHLVPRYANKQKEIYKNEDSFSNELESYKNALKC